MGYYDNQNKRKEERSSRNKYFQKTFSIIASATLLFPHLFGTGVAFAETAEEDPEIPETEEVVDIEETTDVDEPILEETPAEDSGEEDPTDENEEPAAAEAVQEPAQAEVSTTNITPAQVTPGITQENLRYENGRVSLVNQVPGTNIGAILPNGRLIFQTVPGHGTWQPIQTTHKVYVNDELEIFTYSGNERGDSAFLTVTGEGETRPADEQAVLYGRQHFGFIPTERDTRITYSTEAFFTVEMTFPNGEVSTQTADHLGRTSFNFSDNNYTFGPGEIFRVRVFDRDGAQLDLDNPDLFRNLTAPNQSEMATRGEPIPVNHTVTIDPNGGTIDPDQAVTEVTEGETYSLGFASSLNLENIGHDLAGYTVEGTLHDSAGNPVTEIDRFAAEYTPMSDVTLTANWEVSTGEFGLIIENTEVDPEAYDVELTDEDGNVHELPFLHASTSNGNPISYRFENPALPYGNYTLTIGGLDEITDTRLQGTLGGFGAEDGEVTVNDDGSLSLFLPFGPNYSAAFANLFVDGDIIPEPHTVTIDPNGGTIDPDQAVTEVEAGEAYTLPYAYQLDLENIGHDLTGYTVEGTLHDSDGNPVTEIERFTAEYTPMSDVTLTANWEVSTGEFGLIIENTEVDPEAYDVELTDEDGNVHELPFLHASTSNGNPISYRFENPELPYGNYTLTIGGLDVTYVRLAGLGGYFAEDGEVTINEDGTLSLYLPFAPNDTVAFANLFVDGDIIPEPHTVTIDPNGGTMDEDYRVTEVEAGEAYTVPYTFQSDLARPGYTLTGYTVEGDLRDANNEPVTEISRYTGNYTPHSDVTLTAKWEVTSGKFITQLYDDNPGAQTDNYTLTLIAEDGTEYNLGSNQWGSSHRTWEVEDVPNGTYTLSIDGFMITDFEKSGHPNTDSAFTINNDGTATVELDFEDDSASTFIRYRVYGEEIPEAYPLGLEIRDLNGQRTDDVTIYVQNEDFAVFEGSFNEYGQWLSDEDLPVGQYRVTLVTPENTYAVINDSVASQVAVPTDQENVFTIDINEENMGNLSRIYGAFELEAMSFQLGVEVRDSDGRVDTVGVTVTNADDEVFTGSYNEYLQWLTDEELPAGTYTITLDTPEGTVAEINDTTQQYAVATDEDNVFTIELNETNQGSSSAIYGAFRLVEADDGTPGEPGPGDPDPEPEPTPDPDPEPTPDPEPETPGEDDDAPDDDEKPADKDDGDDSEALPKTGVATAPIGLGIATMLSGLGLAFINKKRKEDE